MDDKTWEWFEKEVARQKEENKCPICREKVFILPGIDNRGYKYDHKTKKIYHLSCWTQQQTKTEGVKA
ncbi:hypothetical protein M1M16_gp14 [Methanobacterium virus Drs3]|uniref:Uncharacterized protein n=1 Tax=Methanobacterium virus Drs3 TaxID=1430441 RepID=A0A385AGY2_9CAUD|nr:hypothetical protein M1M16_gp14 [Methanobacterium virus Drs3]AXN53395.1 hypothetical protein Drs3_00014 [Methanobacterium virus Drs3]